MRDYSKVLEKFRYHYQHKYGVTLDDDVLYFYIRVNEMQMDIKRDIRSISKVSFRTGSDYFLYGLGKVTGATIIAGIIIALFFIGIHFR